MSHQMPQGQSSSKGQTLEAINQDIEKLNKDSERANALLYKYQAEYEALQEQKRQCEAKCMELAGTKDLEEYRKITLQARDEVLQAAQERKEEIQRLFAASERIEAEKQKFNLNG